MKRLAASTLIGIAISIAAAMPAIAQTGNAPGPDAGQMQRGPWRGHHEQRPFTMPSERVEARLAYIKTALKITSAQQAQWDAFANVLRKQAADRDKQIQDWRSRMGTRDSAPKPPTIVERMERAQQFHTAAIARLNELSAVVKPLYAVLSDEQKQVADSMLAQRQGQRMHGHEGRRWGT